MRKRKKENRFADALISFNTLTEQNRLRFVLVAAVFSLIILAWFVFHNTHGIFYADEAFYLTIADRLTKGDRLILDEWQVSQFTVFFQYIPYRLFTLITGSKDGVILFMRHLFTAMNLLTYWYIIFKLKKHPLQAIASAFLFCWFVPLIYACNYYTLPIHFTVYVCLILTDKGKRFHRLKLVFVGVLIAATVLTSPGIAVVWMIYAAASIASYLSKKKGRALFADYDFILDINVFKWTLPGIIVSAAAFLIYMQISCGWSEIFKMIPYLLTDPEYDTSAGGNLYMYFWDKLWKTLVYCNLVLSAILFALTVFIVIRRRKILGDIRWKTGLFFAVSFCVILMHLYSLYQKECNNYPSVFYLEEPAFLFAWLGFDTYFLCEKRDKKVFLFWMAGVALSIAKDVISEISFGEGLILCIIPFVYLLPQLASELNDGISNALRKSKKAKDKIPGKHLVYLRKAISVMMTLLVVMTVVWCVTNKYYISAELNNGIKESGVKVCTERIEKGPYKNIYTSALVKNTLNAYFNDMDTIATMTEKAPHITGMMPYAYLYLDRPYPIFSTYLFAHDEMKYEERTETYWQLHPEKRPDIIYMPARAIPYQAHPKYYDLEKFRNMPDEEFASFDWFEGTAIKGEGGVIFRVTKWKQPEVWN